MKKYNQLRTDERDKILLLLAQGNSFRYIGRILKRSHTTIKREIQRNSSSDTLGNVNYLPSKASELALVRKSNSKRSNLSDPATKRYVISRLTKHWSPEQIAGRLKLKAPNSYVCTESIYKFIYAKENKNLRFWEFLRKSRAKRQSLFGRKQQKLKRLQIPNKTSILDRPLEANLRSKVGHLESDLMEGIKSSKNVVSVTSDRKTKYIMLDMLSNKTSLQRIDALCKRFIKLPKSLSQSVTFDNGSENFHHENLTRQCGTKTFFCNAYHAWEKGTVENQIGLIRQYIPKKTDLSKITQTDLNAVALELNARPRKKLGFYTPEETMYKEVNWCTSR